jgi:hypothetical protein
VVAFSYFSQKKFAFRVNWSLKIEIHCIYFYYQVSVCITAYNEIVS